jgi:Holliday junction DNA helicase RuvA
MIAFLSGKLRRKATDHLIVDVNGVGYQVHIPFSTYCTMPETGEEVSLHIHTMREDLSHSFGFNTARKRDVSASDGCFGIGRSLLPCSPASRSKILQRHTLSDDSRLCAIPVSKTAARMVSELTDSKKTDGPSDTGQQRHMTCPMPPGRHLALVNLGQSRRPRSGQKK